MHVVRKGDTLWDLASFYLSDPFLWPEIDRLNTLVVEDPHWIYPSEQLLLPGPGEVPAEVPGEVRVPGEQPEVVQVPAVPVEGPPPELQELKSIFVPREVTRRTLIYRPTPELPALAVTEFDYYRSGMLVPLDELGPRGRVVGSAMPQNVPVDLPETPPKYGRIYVSHPGGEPPEPGDRVLLSRIEQRVKPYGHIVRPTGIATIAAVHEDVSIAVVTDLFDRVQVGNQVTLLETFEMERGVFAQPVGTGPTGAIVAFLDRQWVPSVEDIAFINIGRDQGVDVGDEFEIYVAGRRSGEGFRLPEEHVARGRVVRVTEGTATIRVIEQRHPAIAEGLPVRLVAKMPS
ncbi:MAG: LysM peptidoglycan-binding domain-containing protein [Armatimonadota bacterium]